MDLKLSPGAVRLKFMSHHSWVKSCIPAANTMAPNEALQRACEGRHKYCKYIYMQCGRSVDPSSLISENVHISHTQPLYLIWLPSQWLSNCFLLPPSDFQINCRIQDVIGKILNVHNELSFSTFSKLETYVRQNMEVIQIISECLCSLLQEVNFGQHIPLSTKFLSSLAGQFESDYLGNATSCSQESFRQLLLVLPLCSVLWTIIL